jgi:tetratricopeptide (TPR) repeat protein
MSQVQRSSGISRVELSVGLGLAVLTLLVYCPSFDFPFVNFDDPDYVTQNPQVQAGLTADGIRWAFTTFTTGNWHPLTWLSLELDAALQGGQNAGGFHLTNVLLHSANTLLLFLVLSRMTGRLGRSAVVAALFALHPLHVESVVWVTERKDVLSTLFWMLTLAAYLNYVRRPSIGRYLLVMLMLGLGLMAKPMLVTLPCVLLLLDYWPLQRFGRMPMGQLLLEKVPQFALVVASCAVTFVAQRRGLAVVSLQTFPLEIRLENALLAYVRYLFQMLWPLDLAVYYPHPGTEVSSVQALGAGMLLLLITGLVLGPGRRWPYLAVGWLWYLGTLVPVIGLVQVGQQAMADRYTYVPLIGIFLLLSWGASDLTAAWRRSRPVLAVATGMVLAACLVLTWNQISYWSSNRALWEHAIAATARNPLAHYSLGNLFNEMGRPEAARDEYRKAVEEDPGFVSAHLNLGVVLQSLGQKEEALAEFAKASELDPGAALPHFNLGNVLNDLGQREQARAEYQKAIALDPEDALSHHNLGAVLRDLHRLEEALAEYRKASELDPKDALIHYNLGLVLTDLGQHNEAIAEYVQTLRLRPDYPEAFCNLGQVLLEEGRFSEALTMLRKGHDLGSRDPGWRYASGDWVRLAERMLEVEQRLPSLLKGEAPPAEPYEQLALAMMCRYKRYYALAARLYSSVFAAEPGTADLNQGRRVAAAGAAIRAGLGQGEDAATLTEEVKARLRRQALDWLSADLAQGFQQLNNDKLKRLDTVEGGQARYFLRIYGHFQRWETDADLPLLHDSPARAALPETERDAWMKLEAELKELLTRAVRAVQKLDFGQSEQKK